MLFKQYDRYIFAYVLTCNRLFKGFVLLVIKYTFKFIHYIVLLEKTKECGNNKFELHNNLRFLTTFPQISL